MICRTGALIALEGATRKIALEGINANQIIMNPRDAEEMLLGLTTKTDKILVATDLALQWQFRGITIQPNPWMPVGKIWLSPPGIMITIRCNEHDDCRECIELAEECWAKRPVPKEGTGTP